MKKFIAVLFCLLITLSVCVTVSADTIPDERIKPRLVDGADILTDSEEEMLLSKLDTVSEKLQFDIVIGTTYGLDGHSIRDAADDYYDYNGFGYGSNSDGCVLLVDMQGRDWWISTCGYGITALTDAGIEYIGEKFESDLTDGNYYDGFNTYIDLVEEFVVQAESGQPYDTSNLPKEKYNWFFGILFSLVLGFGIALIVVCVMKGKLKSVRRQPAAHDYLVEGSMNVTASRDMFLYRNVTRRAKPKESSGSSTHSSSSGRSHGGGGGSF